MSVSRGIAQAQTYSTALSVLMIQILAISIAVGAYAPSWWWGVVAFTVYPFALGFRPTRILLLLVMSVFWTYLAYTISVELELGVKSYLLALTAFFISYGISAAGAVGFLNAVPDL